MYKDSSKYELTLLKKVITRKMYLQMDGQYSVYFKEKTQWYVFLKLPDFHHIPLQSTCDKVWGHLKVANFIFHSK